MDERLVGEILAAHADALNAGQDRGQDYLAMFPADQAELAALFAVASLAKRVLAPVEPSGHFRQNLALSLAEAARQRVVMPSGRFQAYLHRDLVLRAAAAGSALAGAGVLALVWRSRVGRGQPSS